MYTRHNTQKPVTGIPLRPDRHWSKDGLFGCWLMNEGSGNMVNDLSGNGVSAVLTNSPTWIAEGINFTGTSHALLPVGFGDKLSGDFTLIAGIRINSVASFGTLFDTRAGSGNGIDFYWNIAPGAGFHAVVDTGSEIQLEDTTASTVGDYVVALTRVGSDIRLYVNGNLQDSDTLAGTASESTTPKIGNQANNGAPFAAIGDMKWFYAYDRGLSASEIALLYREPFRMFEKGDRVLLQSGAAAGVTPYQASPNDAIGLTEDVTARISPLKASVFDTIGLAESVTSRLSFYKAEVFDSIGLTEDVTAQKIISLLEAIVYDSIGLADNADARITPLKADVFDSINLVDNAAIPLGTLEAIVFDTIAMTDAPTSEVLTFLQNIISGEIEQFPQFRGNIQAWNVEIAKYVEKHLRQLKQDIETLYEKVD